MHRLNARRSFRALPSLFSLALGLALASASVSGTARAASVVEDPEPTTLSADEAEAQEEEGGVGHTLLVMGSTGAGASIAVGALFTAQMVMGATAFGVSSFFPPVWPFGDILIVLGWSMVGLGLGAPLVVAIGAALGSWAGGGHFWWIPGLVAPLLGIVGAPIGALVGGISTGLALVSAYDLMHPGFSTSIGAGYMLVFGLVIGGIVGALLGSSTAAVCAATLAASTELAWAPLFGQDGFFTPRLPEVPPALGE